MTNERQKLLDYIDKHNENNYPSFAEMWNFYWNKHRIFNDHKFDYTDEAFYFQLIMEWPQMLKVSKKETDILIKKIKEDPKFK